MLQRIFILLFILSFSFPAFAGFDEGKAAYDKKDWLTAIRELRPLAEHGDDRAMILLANMYASGYGVIPSHAMALSLYKRAAVEKNNPLAMDALGAAYVSATGVNQNLKVAQQWFLRSARLGDQTGAFFYATILAEGNKTRQNEIKPDPYNAYKWFKIAAAEDQNKVFQKYAAKFAQGILAKKLVTPGQAKKADAEAAAWKPVAVKDLGPLPVDPPAPKPSIPYKGATVKSSSPPPKAPDTPLPHSEPLKK